MKLNAGYRLNPFRWNMTKIIGAGAIATALLIDNYTNHAIIRWLEHYIRTMP